MAVRFGDFDFKDGELRKGGVQVKLAPQPMSVLTLLLENAGELVTREQIQRRIWGDQTFVDFDRNLNVCMAQIRAALNDDADSPRFIRTVPKRGYVFLAPVERMNGASPAAMPNSAPARSNTWLAILFIAAAAISLAGVWALWPKPAAVAAPHRMMIAVLPFEASAADQAIADGLGDEIISSLGTLPTDRLGVIARSSVVRYKSARADLKQIAADLSVHYAIEGSVRRNGDRVRVTARLIGVSDQRLLWTDSYEESESDLFKLEQASAARIGAGVARNLFPQMIVARKPVRTPPRDAFEAYRTGRSLQEQGTMQALERSRAAFEQAVRTDPNYADAYAALADSCVSLARFGAPAAPMFARAAEAAGRALELDETSAEAHNALANVQFWRDWSWSSAEQHFTRALTINPSYAAAYHDYAWFLVAMGRTEQGLIALRRALALDPLSVRINIDAGWLLQQAHRYQEAINQAKRAQQLDPALEEARYCIARAEFLLGRNAQPPPVGPDPYSAAVHFAAIGDKNQALDSLEKAFAERAIQMPLANVDPAFTGLQNEPRFQRLIVKLAYP